MRLARERPAIRLADIVAYRIFRGLPSTWDELCGEAAAFATVVGRERLIGVSQSEDRQDGVITVWYWDNVPDESPSSR